MGQGQALSRLQAFGVARARADAAQPVPGGTHRPATAIYADGDPELQQCVVATCFGGDVKAAFLTPKASFRLDQIVVLSPNSSAGRGLRNSTAMPQLT